MEIQIETIPDKDLSGEKRDQLIQWFVEEFGYIPLKWADPDWYVLASNGPELVGRLGIVDRIVTVNGKPVPVGGISGVVTKQDLRKKGIGSALMSEAVNVIEGKLKTPFGLLLCRQGISGFYVGLGWRMSNFSTRFEQPAGKMAFPKLTMTYSCTGHVWPEGPVDLNGLPW